ncbi:hypothetical protein XENTR_v10012845 [Xenopus tropicalis]|nr:hypothetical protein XENTR_v10012845 [Xenopus tropicalis]
MLLPPAVLTSQPFGTCPGSENSTSHLSITMESWSSLMMMVTFHPCSSDSMTTTTSTTLAKSSTRYYII